LLVGEPSGDLVINQRCLEGSEQLKNVPGFPIAILTHHVLQHIFQVSTVDRLLSRK
jgi:hypothetical protein